MRPRRAARKLLQEWVSEGQKRPTKRGGQLGAAACDAELACLVAEWKGVLLSLMPWTVGSA